MNKLKELGIKYKTDKATMHSYIDDVYYPLFKDKEEENIKILEIGAGRFGGSVKMWKEFFKNGDVYLFDCFFIVGGDDIGPYSASISDVEPHGITCIKGNQLSREDLDNVEKVYSGDFDYIIDDGAHVNDAIQISLARLFRSLKSGGSYIIEDLDTARTRTPDRVNNWLNGDTVECENKLYHTEDAHLLDSLYFLQKDGVWMSSTLTDEEKRYLVQNIAEIRVDKTQKICIIKKR